ncbi:MAG TPA: DUF2442 domain-containing protein [Solirubrobacteraceae bacterium]|jgi:hypothetical protein
MEKLVDVVAVEVLGDYQLRLTFEDGVVGDVSFAGREWRGVFEPFTDPAVFAQVFVDAELGTIAWPGGQDMAPEPLYEAARAHRAPDHRAPAA